MKKKHVLKEIPQGWIDNNKRCRKCSYGSLYTVRVRFRIGKKVDILNYKYGNITLARKQVNIIVGDICIDCGKFQEDPDFKTARIVTLKKYSKSGMFQQHYKKLLKEAKKD